MRGNKAIWIVAFSVGGSLLLTPGSTAAQLTRRDTLSERYLSVGISLGLGVVQSGARGRSIGRDDSWDFGPVFGGRVEWWSRRWAAGLTVDAQPFRAEGNLDAGEFRAMYLLPFYAVGSGSRRIGLGIGMGVFDFGTGPSAEGLTLGFVAGASGSARITGPYFVELGWKRINNVQGLRGNVWSLQLVRRWRL